MIDLHMHSTGSDGQYTPAELMKKAKEAGITVAAITDHDSIDGVREGQKAAEELGIRFIPGIEISVKSEAEMHILGYDIDIDSPAIRKACERFVELREERAKKIIDYLQEKGIEIGLSEVQKKAGGNVIGRPHFAGVLLEKGYVCDIREAFDRYLATEEFKKIERPKPTPAEGIAMIHDAGGKAVLAHPVTLRCREGQLEALVAELKELGLDGIETYYSAHTEEQIEECHQLAREFGLFETAGSDFHGEEIKPEIYLGKTNLVWEGSEWDRLQ